MVVQYPHTVVLSVVVDSTQDGNGNWQAGDSTPLTFPGRFEPNSGGRFIKGANGEQIVYSGVIYTKTKDALITLGANITVSGVVDGVPFEVVGTIKNYSFGQLNTTIWI